MVCATNLKFHFIGFLCALGSTITFVLQNVVCKQLFNAAPLDNSKKLDKLNLLFYPSISALILMFPPWLYYDGHHIFDLTAKLASKRVIMLFIMNGISHFTQCVLAFSILALVSPITYSIGSLIKRIFVISASILYFGDVISTFQAFGFSLTFVGLFLYNRASKDVALEERKHKQADRKPSLPLSSK